MALNKGEGAGFIYLSVANGKLVRQHREPNPNTTTRVNKNGKTVHEEFFRDLVGNIVNIEVAPDRGYGKSWNVTFQDGDDKYMVQMQYSGRYSSSFLKALPNVNPSEPVKFMPWEMDDKNKPGKTITGVTMYQNDGNGWVKILPAYTKDDPNGLPEMKKVRVKGQDVWDDSDMMSFLEEKVKEWLGGDDSAVYDPNDDAPF